MLRLVSTATAQLASGRAAPAGTPRSALRAAGAPQLLAEVLVDPFPAEGASVGVVRATEVATRSGLTIDRTPELELIPDLRGGDREEFTHRCQQLLVGVRLAQRTVRVDGERARFRHADGIGELHTAATGDARRHDVLGDEPRRVRTGAVHLGGVLARECATAMRAVTTVGVHDDLPAGQAGIPEGSTDGECPGRVEELPLRDEPVPQAGVLTRVPQHGLARIPHLHAGCGLHADDHFRHGHDAAALVADRHLGLAIRADELTTHGGLAEGGQRIAEPAGVVVTGRHEDVPPAIDRIAHDLVASVSEHHALVAGTTRVHALRDVRALGAQAEVDRGPEGAEVGRCQSNLAILAVADVLQHLECDALRAVRVERSLSGEIHHREDPRHPSGVHGVAGLVRVALGDALRGVFAIVVETAHAVLHAIQHVLLSKFTRQTSSVTGTGVQTPTRRQA